MTLLDQVEVISISFLFGIVAMIIYDVLNRYLYNFKGKLLRLFAEVFIFTLLSFIYFILMLYSADAKQNIFMPLFLILGAICYIFFLHSSFLYVIEKFYKKNCMIFNKINIFFVNKIAIIKLYIKKVKEKKNEKIARSKKSK